MTSLKDQMKLLKDAGKDVAGKKSGTRKKPLGTFKDFPKEIIKTIISPFSKK